jgi:hypothetical protein
MTTFLRSIATAALLACTALAAPACVAGSDTGGDEQDLTQKPGRFETFKGLDSKYYFQLLAGNGAPLLRSEGYTTLSSARGGITSAQKNGVLTARFHVLATDDGAAYFNLVAANGELLAMSDAYASQTNAAHGVDAVIHTIATASTAAAAAGAKFETLKGDDGLYYFQLRAENGRIVLTSDSYASKSGAAKGTKSAQQTGLDATSFDLVKGDGEQYAFRILATNKNVLARSEMYASKSNAIAGATSVRALLRKLAGASALTDAEIQAEIAKASDGLLFTSESDYPFEFVSTDLGTASITQDLVQTKLASYVDQDPAADKPMASLFGMSATWQTWKDQGHNCSDTSYPEGAAICDQMRNLEQVLESNMTDLHVYYFGKKGSAGHVDGIGVSVFIVGKAPSGRLVGVRTLAIWT